MATTAKRKEKFTTSAPTASVRDLAEEAGRSLEAAAILRAVSAAVVPRFHADGGRLPELLLRRHGTGPRPAQTESVVEAEVALENLAREFEQRARALMDLRVELGDGVAPAPSNGGASDEAVRRDELADELKSASDGPQGAAR